MFAAVTMLVIAACSGSTDHAAPTATGDPSTRIVRDIDALERAKHGHQACSENRDCPTGSRCDGNACTWDCLSDSDCGEDHSCGALGACGVSTRVSTLARSNIDVCLAMDPAVVRAALVGLNQETPARTCDLGADSKDDGCPCGSYCNDQSQCHVDCLAEANPPPGLACAADQNCTPSGRCVPATSSTDDPPVVETLEIDPGAITANTAAGAVLVPVTVRLHTNSLAALRDPNPSTVRYHIAGVGDVGLGTPHTGPVPILKCAESDALAASCELAGGWRFHIGTGNLESDARTIWVQIPQTDAATRWTLVALSESAAAPATAAVRSQPIAIPSTDPGHYTGTVSWNNAGGPGSTLTLPVEAFVTADVVALYDTAKLLLPDGHAVFSRDPAKATLLGWLTSSVGGANAEYDVRVDLGALAYNAATGHLDGGLSLTTGTGAAATAFTLSLDRSDGPSTPACGASCAAGTYCEAATSTCLPGSGPAASTIVAVSAAVPSKMLSSASVAAWAPAVNTLISTQPWGSPVKVGSSGSWGFGQAYCYQANESSAALFTFVASQSGIGAVLRTPTIQQPSQDFGCVAGSQTDTPAPGSPEYAQTMFPFENRTTQVALDFHNVQTFNLLEECLKDLAVVPPANPTFANTLDIAPARSCANLAQFYLALLAAHVSAPDHNSLMRLATLALRQWLAVNTLVASGSIQNRNYDDVLGIAHPVPGTQDDTPQGRLGYALDLVDSGLRVMLDPEVRPQVLGPASVDVAVAPDYRAQPRPDHRWTFNGTTSNTVHDAEGNIDFVTTGVAPANDALFARNATSATCQTASPVAFDNDRFTISFRLTGHIGTLNNFGAGPTATLFEKVAPDGSRLWLEGREELDGNGIFGLFLALRLTLRDSSGKSVAVGSVPWINDSAGWGLITVAANNTKRRLNFFTNPPSDAGGTYTINGSMGGGSFGNDDVHWGAPGIVKLTCNLADHQVGTNPWAPNGLLFDELALWSRPISTDEMGSDEYTQMTAHYQNNVHNEAVPPSVLPPGQEQGVSLAVHMLESANADLGLVHDYLQAERGISYPECYIGGASPARDRAMARAGRNLRLVSVLEAEAAHIATFAGATTAPWFPRYQAARQSLAGTRASVMQVIQQLTACENPLGISEAVLPLYVGQTTGASERFFASTRFLTAIATDPSTGPLHLATAALADAQSAYNQQVVSDFQRDLSVAEKNQAIEKLKIGFEQTLRKYCGLPSTGEPTGNAHALFDQFEAGTLDAQTCYLKTELGGACSPLAILNTPLDQIPPSCLRGQLGELVVAIQSAAIDLTNAKNDENRNITKLGLDTTYCMEREHDLAQRTALLGAQAGAVDFYQRDGLEAEELFTLETAAISTFTGEGSFDPTAFLSFGEKSAKYADDIDNAAYTAMITKADADLAVKDCFHQADNTKFAIDAAHGTVARAAHQSVAAILAFRQAQDEIDGQMVAANGQIGLETNLDRTPPHLTFWLDDKIAAYTREMAYARRLMYLAVRAYEYESQQRNSGLRAQVLSARQPNDLQAVVNELNSHTAPFADNDPNFRAQSEPEVFSLRTELLQIQDLTGNVNLAPGDPPRSDIYIFKALLASDATKMYTANGVYRGHGIRFTMRQGPWSAEKCAERLSRIVPLIQTDAPQGLPDHPDVTLIQMNEFGSQQCTTTTPAPLLMTRAGAAVNLVGTDTTANLAVPAPSQEIGLQLAPTTILDRQQLERDLPMGDPSAFAGRGMYGDYILLFPADDHACTPSECRGWSEDAIAQVKDVLLRFEMVDGQRQVH